MPNAFRIPFRGSTLVPAALATFLALGWAAREVAHARASAELVKSTTVTLDQIKLNDYEYGGQKCGRLGLYVNGDTPGSTRFVTGRFVLDPGKSPHPPHVHDEEEVMVIESGRGEIIVGDKATPIGPGSVMYTEPRVSHGINNTGTEPIVFTFIKWVGKPSNSN